MHPSYKFTEGKLSFLFSTPDNSFKVFIASLDYYCFHLSLG